ncbi:MAG: helix-turn-helix transcriptional regulator [Acidimicrobiales bacterium]|nr:helix-turn-helix transcriptional regulator [Acidimicrobiales bacterium]
MRQTSFAAMQCSLARSLEMVGDWWSPLILRDLALGPRRFDELAVDLGISRNLLATRLEGLAVDGIVTRLRYLDHPPRYRYQLTQAGVDLVPVLMALTAWGDRWATPDDGPPIRYRHRTCGHVFTPTVCCSSCAEAVSSESVHVLPGPGGRPGPGTMLTGEFIGARLMNGDEVDTKR